MKRSTKIVLWATAGIVVASVAAGLAYRNSGPKGVRVRTTEVRRRGLVSLVTANGTVAAKKKVDLSANVMGQITQLNVEEGEQVEKGDLLAVIDQVTYSASVDSRRAALQAMEAELRRVREAAEQAQRDLERTERQFREQIIPAAEFDRVRSQRQQANASVQSVERQVAQAQAELEAAGDALTKTEIRAPMGGVLTRRNVEQGEVVVTGTMNNPGTILMTISDMSTIEAVLEVDQTDVPLLRPGQEASVLIDAYPDTPFPGTVAEIASSPIQGSSALGGAATGTDYEVKVTLREHPAGIRPGLTVTADITTAVRAGVLTVPLGALVVREQGPEQSRDTPPAPDEPASVASRARDMEGVYVVDSGKVDFRAVRTGIKGELDVEVVEGLEEGEEIVVGPFQALRELRPEADVVVDNTESRELE